MTKPPEGTVLYVDDDEINRNTFALVFREAGFEVKEAATGGEALRLAEEMPDVVVLDVNLPDINGVEVCRHIKMHPATRAIPVMHMSAVYVSSEDKTHALEEGADAYVTKPVEPRELVAQVKALLRMHQAEERAEAAAQQWQATFAAINDGVCLVDHNGRVLRCNPATERILQRAAAKILGRDCDELIPVTPGSGERSVFRRMLQTRHREVAELAVGDRWLQTVADPMLSEAGGWSGAVWILSDITERKHLEERLSQSQKMEAVGRLAGGVAHDFNNLLTAVTGNVSLLLAGTPEQDPDRELLLAIDRAAWRAAELTGQLLRFSRRSTPRLVPTDLRPCLDEIAAILSRTIDPRITLEVRSDSDLWVVEADSGQINQVLLNLCLNARDAMLEGGHLLLEAENVVMDEDQARQNVQARPGKFVCLRVRDSGHGIAPDVLPHIFEPFFTTKELGKGTGLGLATVFGVVGQHQGWVECSSRGQSGDLFHRLFAAVRTGPTTEPARGCPRGAGRDGNHPPDRRRPDGPSRRRGNPATARLPGVAGRGRRAGGGRLPSRTGTHRPGDPQPEHAAGVLARHPAPFAPGQPARARSAGQWASRASGRAGHRRGGRTPRETLPRGRPGRRGSQGPGRR